MVESLDTAGVSKKRFTYIELHFYQDASVDTIQPQIDIQFDTGLYHIDIGMFWDDELGLEREDKRTARLWQKRFGMNTKTEMIKTPYFHWRIALK